MCYAPIHASDIACEPHPQQMFSNINVSLVPRPHPAHARRRGLVSQVQSLNPSACRSVEALYTTRKMLNHPGASLSE